MSDEELGPEFSEAEKESLESVKDRVETGEFGGQEDRYNKEDDKNKLGDEERGLIDRIDAGGDGEQILKDIASGNQRASNKEGSYLEEDSRLGDIRQELIANWESKHGSRYDDAGILKAEFQDYMLGNPAELKTGIKPQSLEDRAKQLFSERFPDVAKNYQEKEQMRIYDDPGSDPAIRDLETDITRLTNQAVESERSGMIGQAKSAEANSFGNDRWSSNNTAISAREWGRFVERFPEKAEAYADRVPEISQALRRQAESSEASTSDQASFSAGTRVAEAENPDPLHPGSRVETAYAQENSEEDILKNPEFWSNLRSLVELYVQDEVTFQQRLRVVERENPRMLNLLLDFLAAMARYQNRKK